MPRPRDLLLRTTLSALAFGGFLLVLSAAPSARGKRAAPAAAPAPLPPEPPTSDSRSGTFTFNGVPMLAEETAVPACDAANWNPLTAGYCVGRCTPLVEQRTARGATFAWRDETAGSVHSLALSCPVLGAEGQAAHFSFATPTTTAGWAAPAVGPHQPRTAPVPGLPGAVEMVQFESGGLTLFVDRPPSASTALEELQLALFDQGWRVAGGPDLRLPPDSPPTRVFVRGAEVYVVTLETQDDNSSPLLVSAYSRYGWAPEVPR